ncbi:MAG: NAD-dependent epimerase/dehydratase family protein [Planctomycetota bacterium]|jgi:nucleoside-diphosphate-sugar epimerase
MLRKPAVLLTGASGEVGYGLIEQFSRVVDTEIIALDLKKLPHEHRAMCSTAIVGDILDENLLQRLVTEYEIHAIYHLAALLSTRAEYTPEVAHRVNVDGTLNLLKLAHEQSRWHGHPVRFIFPSSIAVYGLPNLRKKKSVGKIKEEDWVYPTTMYGCNKAYCEQLGRYYTMHYRQLAAEAVPSGVDFRAVRFPGLISAVTMPSGGTSDYAVEMLHFSARGEPYACFVAEEARIPFLAMPDAIKALVQLADASPEQLSRRVYNVAAFSLTAAQLRDRTVKAFPDARITFEPDEPRARIVDSWPEDVDDTPARHDWGWSPDLGVGRAFDEYLIPGIKKHYEENGGRRSVSAK